MSRSATGRAEPVIPLRPDEPDWGQGVKTGIRWPIVVGLLTLAGFVAGFGWWAARVPLSSASVASGVVAAKGQNLTIQHKEGGIVETIFVREGQAVKAGDPLVAFQQSPARTDLNLLRRAEIGLLAREARLRAERDNTDLVFSAKLTNDARAIGLGQDLDEQRSEFSTRRERYAQDAQIMDQQIAAIEERLIGLERQKQATNDQLAVLKDELLIKKDLVTQKLTPRSQYLALQRQEDELEGRVGALEANIGEAKTKIIETRQNKQLLQKERAETAVTALNEVRRRLADTQERIVQAKEILDRTIVRAPTDGMVVTLDVNTPGAVIAPGEALAVLLPTNDGLIVEARLSQLDSDIVRVGQAARLRFSALNVRTTPEVEAVVTFISPDTITDPRTNETYFVTRLAISESLPAGIAAEQITPGMPVEVYITIGERTFLEYLIKPITDGLARAINDE